MFTVHLAKGQPILPLPFISRELGFAVMIKIPLLSGIMKKTLPKFSIHTHPSQVGQLCRKVALAEWLSFTTSSPVRGAALPTNPHPNQWGKETVKYIEAGRQQQGNDLTFHIHVSGSMPTLSTAWQCLSRK